MGTVDGHEDIMPLALSVVTVDQARFVVNTLRMLQRYHETVHPLKDFGVQGTVFATAENGTLVVAAPVDYVSWSEMLDRFSANDRFSSKPHELHIAGKMTQAARSHIVERGWELHENSALLTRQ